MMQFHEQPPASTSWRVIAGGHQKCCWRLAHFSAAASGTAARQAGRAYNPRRWGRRDARLTATARPRPR